MGILNWIVGYEGLQCELEFWELFGLLTLYLFLQLSPTRSFLSIRRHETPRA